MDRQLYFNRTISNSTILGISDTVVTFGTPIANKINGEMVGVAKGGCGIGGPPNPFDPTRFDDYIPYIYKLNSVGQFSYLKNLKFPAVGISKYNYFDKVIPYKDSLYIIGRVSEGDVSKFPWSCSGDNQTIIKTDGNGNVAWKNKLGYYGGCETIKGELVCKDGGLIVSYANTFDYTYNPSALTVHNRNTASVTKYNTDGTIKFNKAFRRPLPNIIDIRDSAAWAFTFTSIVETPNNEYLVTGEGGGTIENGIGAYPSGPWLIKLDANGNKLWEKMPLFDSSVYRTKSLLIHQMIPHPNGGYIGAGYAYINEWDNSIPNNGNCSQLTLNGPFYCYNFKRCGGLLVKINESGEVEWQKVFRQDYKVDVNDVYGLKAQEIDFSNITTSYTNGIPTGFILNGVSPGYMPWSSNIKQNVIVKTDFDGNILWNKQYYEGEQSGGSHNDYYGNRGVQEEPEGTLVLPSYASPEADVTMFLPPQKGILRLDKNGNLGDATCSLSPKLIVHDIGLPFKYDNKSYLIETASPLTGSLPSVATYDRIVPVTTTTTCVNPLTADFTYQVVCSDAGSVVKFTNTSTAGSWFSYNFGDPASGSKNVSDTASSQHLYTASGIYTVTLTIWDGDSIVSNSISKAIATKNRRYITMTPNNFTVCAGSTINFTTSLTPGSFAPDCNACQLLANVEGLSGLRSASEYAASMQDSVFFNSLPLSSSMQFAIYSGNSCLVSDTVVVKVIPTVNISVRGENLSICLGGDSALLIASGSNSYLWNPDNTTNDSLKVLPNITTNYLVWSGKNGVCGNDSAEIKVNIFQPPTIDAGKEQIIYLGTEVQLSASGGTTYQWKPTTGLSSATAFNPIANPTTTTIYTVTATDANGCVGSDTVTIFVKSGCGELTFPNAFSPNGDKINDVLVLTGKCITDLEVIIFDRWGEQIVNYQLQNTNDETSINVWDGIFKGKAMNAGVFVYYVKATFISNEIVTRKGNVSLIR